MSHFLYDESFISAALAAVTKAKKTIYISTFKLEITTKKRGEKLFNFFDILGKKAADGVRVCILTNKPGNRGHIPDTNAYALRYMRPGKIQIRFLPNDRVVHAKLLIVDGQCALFGSHNLSVRSCHNNFELSFFLDDKTTLEYVTTIFNAIWATAKET